MTVPLCCYKEFRILKRPDCLQIIERRHVSYINSLFIKLGGQSSVICQCGR